MRPRGQAAARQRLGRPRVGGRACQRSGGWVAARENGELQAVHAAALLDLTDLADGVTLTGRLGREARARAEALAAEIADLRRLEAPVAGNAAAVALRALHAGIPLGFRRVVSADYAARREIRPRSRCSTESVAR